MVEKRKLAARLGGVLTPDKLVVRRAVDRFYNGNVSDMAADLGFREQTIYYWLTPGGRSPGQANLARILKRHNVTFSDLWVPDSEAGYFRGFRLTPDSPGFRQLESNIAAALKVSRPDLADKLGL